MSQSLERERERESKRHVKQPEVTRHVEHERRIRMLNCESREKRQTDRNVESVPESDSDF
jgi:hypothetical protein